MRFTDMDSEKQQQFLINLVYDTLEIALNRLAEFDDSGLVFSNYISNFSAMAILRNAMPGLEIEFLNNILKDIKQNVMDNLSRRQPAPETLN